MGIDNVLKLVGLDAAWVALDGSDAGGAVVAGAPSIAAAGAATYGWSPLLGSDPGARLRANQLSVMGISSRSGGGRRLHQAGGGSVGPVPEAAGWGVWRGVWRGV